MWKDRGRHKLFGGGGGLCDLAGARRRTTFPRGVGTKYTACLLICADETSCHAVTSHAIAMPAAKRSGVRLVLMTSRAARAPHLPAGTWIEASPRDSDCRRPDDATRQHERLRGPHKHPPDRSGSRSSHSAAYLLKTSAALCPPKPRLSEMATWRGSSETYLTLGT